MKRLTIFFAIGIVLLASVAVAQDFDFVQGFYLTWTGNNNAVVSVVRAEVSGVSVLDFLFTTSDTREYRMTSDILLMGTNALEYGSDPATVTWSMDYVSASKMRIADSDAVAWGAGDDAIFVSDGTNLDVTIGAGTLTMGDGGTTNYMSIDGDGDLLVAGSGSITMNDTLIWGWGTVAADGTVASDGTNVDWTIVSGTFTMGDGGSSNYWSWASTGIVTLVGGAEMVLNDNVEMFFGTSSAESQIASNATDTTFTVVSGDLVLGTDGFMTRLEGAVQLGAVSTWANDDETPDVGGNSYWNTGTNADTVNDFDAAGAGVIEAGNIIVIISKGDITFDVTSSGLVGGTTDLISASGDLTAWLYDGTDWILIMFIDQSDSLA